MEMRPVSPIKKTVISKDTVDFIVVGSGISGLYTALELAEHGKVLLLAKAEADQTATYFAQGGVAAAVAENDTPELHMKDTLAAGAGLCCRKAVEALVREGPGHVRKLIDIGVPFDRNARNKLLLAREGAHSRRRVLRAGGDATGKAIQTTLRQTANRHPDINCMEDVFVLDLLIGDGTCHGVITWQEDPPAYRVFFSKATVLATGGLGQVYAFTTNPPVATGDGIAMAFRAGVELTNLEFVQFHPTALFHPGKSGFLISEAVRGEGGRLFNHRGQRFMPNYHPQAELAPRDVVSRAIVSEMQRHGTDCVYLDLTHLPGGFLKERFPTIYRTLLTCGITMENKPIPVAPAAHYSMGGIKTNLDSGTSLPGLYAVGEVACTGVHGANRLASNSLLEGLVFGHRAALAAARYVKKHRGIPREAAKHYKFDRAPAGTRVPDISPLQQRLQHIMQQNAGVIRSGKSLARAKYELGNMLAGVSLCARDKNATELKNMLTVAYLIVSAAQRRSNSCGSHFRADHTAAKPAVTTGS